MNTIEFFVRHGWIPVVCLLLFVIYLFIKKHWATAITLLFVWLGLTFYWFMLSLMNPFDYFTKDLYIPTDIEVNELDSWNHQDTIPKNAFQTQLIAALFEEDNQSPISVELTKMEEFAAQHPDLFFRYLCTSPEWRVYDDRGFQIAKRRWNIENNWRKNFYDSYDYFNIKTDKFHDKKIPRFHNNVILYLEDVPWDKEYSQTIHTGFNNKIASEFSYEFYNSKTLITLTDFSIEISEETLKRKRLLTEKAVHYMEDEFSSLPPTVSGIFEKCPNTPLISEENILRLHTSSPGMYSSEIWINPMESGKIYLKAFEVTKNTPLSVRRLKEKTNEWVGWSENPEEKFYSNTHFTIYEVDWGNFYAARFEVWFQPDSGEKERKLMEKVYKIEGWMR